VEIDPFFDPIGLTADDHAPALDRLEAVDAESIALAAATPPEEWRVPPSEKAAFAEYVSRRKTKLLAHFGRGATS
jgi:hypothetical protein